MERVRANRKPRRRLQRQFERHRREHAIQKRVQRKTASSSFALLARYVRRLLVLTGFYARREIHSVAAAQRCSGGIHRAGKCKSKRGLMVVRPVLLWRSRAIQRRLRPLA